MNKKVLKGLWWLFIAINLLAIIFLWWNGSSRLLTSAPGQLIAFGRIAGLLAGFSLALMLLFMSRASFLESIYGHAQLNKWHRNLGFSLSLFILSHPILLIAGYSLRDGKNWFNQLLFFLEAWDDILPAIVAFVIFVAVIISSMPVIKKKLKYEKWHSIHLLTYLAFILAIGHQVESGDFNNNLAVVYWYVFNFGCLGCVLLFRWLKPLLTYNKHRFFVDKVVNENNNVTSIYIKGRKIGEFKFNAGQFANLFIIDKGFIWPHPFSFSRDFNGEYLRFTIKELGDYTAKVKFIKKGTPVVIDGPLGKFTADDVSNKKFLLIAGGVGVTPIMALAQSLAKNNKDTIIINAVKNKSDLVFNNDLKNATDKYFVFISEEKSENIGDHIYGGRVDISRLEKLVADYKEREIYICGPEPMIVSMVNALNAEGVAKKQIHSEKFNY